MPLHTCCLTLVLTAFLGTPVSANDDVAELLKQVRAVGPQGNGPPMARVAWARLVARGLTVLRALAELDRDKNLPADKRTDALRKLFASTRDLPQSRAVAAKLKEHGATVSVADHFGFLRDWYVIGPFDARGMKGFKAVYPPEEKVD